MQSFEEFTTDQGLFLLGVLPINVIEDDSVFPCDNWAAKTNEPLSSALATSMQCATVGDMLLYLGRSIALELWYRYPHKRKKEDTCRELISPILSAAVALTEGVEKFANYKITGTRAAGSVDWVLRFNRFSIVVVEALHSAYTLLHCTQSCVSQCWHAHTLLCQFMLIVSSSVHRYTASYCSSSTV
jgi:hypothetical protein